MNINRTTWTVALALVLVCTSACKKKLPGEMSDAGPRACVAIAQTGLCWRKPSAWKMDRVKASDDQPPSAAGLPAEDAGPPQNAGSDLGASQLIARGTRQTARASNHPPRVEIYQSQNLPTGSSATDFLAANRLAQQKALGTISVRHLEVEPVRRQGRRGYHVRDAFDVPLPQGGAAPVSQHALLLVDGSRGYVIVVSLLEDDLPRYADEINGWLQSVRFVQAAQR